MKIGIKNGLIIFIFIITATANAEAKKLKLFINDIAAESGVSQAMAAKAKDFLSLSIFENFKSDYQIITDEDIKMMYKKAADLQASGCDAQTCVLQIAEAINADEIIYGTMKRDEGKIRLIIQNLKRDAKSLSIDKKSQVSEHFYESQLEWYSKEIAKKLIDPEYTIDPEKAPVAVSGKFEVAAVDLDKVKGVDISVMNFKSSDESISKILDFLKELIESGDELFKKKNYAQSRITYKDVINKINTQIVESKRNKISYLIDSVKKRIESTHYNEIKIRIDSVDNQLKLKGTLDSDIILSGIEKYREIIVKLDSIPANEKESLQELDTALKERINSLFLAWSSLFEKEGDAFYNEFKFSKAIELYNDGLKKLADAGGGSDKVRERITHLDKKKRICMETGTSWLENKVRSYCDQAEYFNIRDKKGDARKVLDKAGWIISANSLFMNGNIKAMYDEYGRLVGHEGDISGKTEFYKKGRETNYGIYSLSFYSVSALSFYGGFYYNSQLQTITKDYNSLAAKYKSSTNFDEATKYHNDMKARKKEADKVTLYRNIFYGAGAGFLGVASYFTYQFFTYKSAESDIKSAWNQDIFFMPLISYNYGTVSTYNSNEREYFLGAVMMMRF